MKKTSKKATFQTLDKKIDGIASTVGKFAGGVGKLTGTVDSLARSTKEGFDRMDAFHNEMTEFAHKTSLTLFNIDGKLQTVDQRLDAIEKTLGPLVQVSSFMQKEIRELNTRVTRLEHNAGIK
ncbi:MAG: hypothetical protein A2W52_03695 [Candidatus Taylorbacteria bacterium RIFCSPHIGHO2_02_49_25]|uniref:t-SNARE coiled-coil homology domain-containing protein n=1 Tax=Candidatus Taylorbacteria bacterium RIFCSPHIGHO2_02_49_25 TaxID=1802305 RepID=A0A1G2MF28_9BACT|nr:MAG: hypothetical protein UY62_C0059G0008 [Parcubacteria group bacterium GW2011_GWF2_50_9]OHA21307.1 MAG: hypothetical protein A2759_00910 [Candidatus Taylorbacteria bacterium RIFCSPHIGHO2_01_FULL_49_60]OHA22525.1 MAG: hypothetical protein A2W52_03695 [Candidatus Taylorbacteria bacterium RIFCSPHIGHO2_02_49_25]OHA36720.1 MAG: hypothetical protein A2W65_01815 [Candidatus Taylorbacteria bacterium RIFCSPLOWO2_02_50_13]OHA48261.1 MAG: hypothetical protein A3G61_00605 [Candidatus Taylorbacteria ba